MFLIAAFAVFTVAYAFSAVLGELVFTSPAERELPVPVRVALGFFFLVVYFAAAWQVMSIRQAWLLAAILLGVYIAALPRVGRAAGRAAGRLGSVAAAHARPFAAYLAAGAFFFFPLIAANTYGPFTEGGGDITIYADTTQYLVQHDLTARGQPSASRVDAVGNVKAALAMELDRHVLNALAEDRYVTADRTLINPPVTENPVYRHLVLESMSPFLYAPYGAFFFLAQDDNYHVYFAIQAFAYAILLLCAWSVPRKLGPRASWLCLALAVSSHAIVSVFYNMYSAHALSLAVCAIVLALLPTIRLFSRAGLRGYFVTAGYLWFGYPHYLSIVGPLVLVAAFNRSPAPAPAPVPAPDPRWRVLARRAVVAVVVALFILVMISGVQKSAPFVYDLLVGRMSAEGNVFMGQRIPVLSFAWLAFVFGFISQQHLQPFAIEFPPVNFLVGIGIAIGIACLALGAAAAVRARAIAPRDERDTRFALLMYAAIVAVVAVHLFLAQSYVYTQAKGAQNVLVALYAAMVIPLGIALRLAPRDPLSKKLAAWLGMALAAFVVALLAPRALYGYKLARTQDRVTILDPSFFEEARRIRREDDRPFVLFEPYKNADVYLANEPFFGARMVPTRHLALTRMNFESRPPYGERVNASQLIAPADIPHLWTIAATKEANGRLVWHAERVVAAREPTVHMFADVYERAFGERPRSDQPGDKGMFSFLRNGAVMLYLPAGTRVAAEVIMEPREQSGFAALLAEVRDRVAKGQFPPGELSQDGKRITLRYALASGDAPALLRLANYGGEYWTNVRVDGKDR